MTYTYVWASLTTESQDKTAGNFVFVIVDIKSHLIIGRLNRCTYTKRKAQIG